MDVQTAAIFGGAVVVIAALVFVISFFGVREKTYEEAIAEQRKRSDNHLLLGNKSERNSSKDKKLKKPKKVVKEKVVVSEKKSRVEFEPDADVMEEGSPVDEKKKKKKERGQVKPILVNKEEHSPVSDKNNASPVNHFDSLQPLDDLELKLEKGGSRRSSQVRKDDTDASEKAPKPQRVPKSSTHETHKPEVTEVVPTPRGEAEVVAAVPVTATSSEEVLRTPERVSKKDKRRKKNELTDLIDGYENVDVNGTQLEPLLRKAVLSNTEISNLIDVLLNKQQHSVGESEWIERGRPDSVASLKKLLEEKEKALAEEQVVLQSCHTKLKELRADFNQEKSRSSQIRRQLEETIQRMEHDGQIMQNRLQQAMENGNHDRQKLQNQLQQLTAKYQEESRRHQEEINILNSGVGRMDTLQMANDNLEKEVNVHRVNREKQDEQMAALQRDNECLLARVKQLEMHMQGVEGRKQEEEGLLRKQINQLTSQVNELEQTKLHLMSQVKQECDRLNHMIIDNSALKEQLSHLQNSSSHNVSQLEKQLELAQVSQVEAEKSLQKLKQCCDEYASQKLAKEKELQALRESHEVLLQKVNVAPVPQKVNGEVDKAKNEEITSVRIELVEKQNQLKEKDAHLQRLTQESLSYQKSLQSLREEVELHRKKNNESLEKSQQEVKNVQSTCQRVLQRLFPSVKVDFKDFPSWIAAFENQSLEVQKVVLPSANSASEDLDKLQSQVGHYKSILAETEGVLMKLQKSVEDSEFEWRASLESKDVVINRLQEAINSRDEQLQRLRDSVGQMQGAEEAASEMQVKLRELQSRLQSEESEKRDLANKYKEICQNKLELQAQLDRTCDQVTRLESLQKELQLVATERDRVKIEAERLVSSNNAQSSLLKKSQEELRAEQDIVLKLQTEISQLKGQNSSVAATNGPPIESEPVANEHASGKK